MGSGPEMKSYIVFLSVCTSAVLKKQKTEQNKKINLEWRDYSLITGGG